MPFSFLAALSGFIGLFIVAWQVSALLRERAALRKRVREITRPYHPAQPGRLIGSPD